MNAARVTRSLAMTLAMLSPIGIVARSSDKRNTTVSQASTDIGDAADNVGTVAGNVANNVGSVVDNATDSVAGANGDNGLSKGYAVAMVAALNAMPGSGAPTVDNLQTAAKLVPAPAKVTGIEDSNNDGTDDDAKATVESDGGNDKA